MSASSWAALRSTIASISRWSARQRVAAGIGQLAEKALHRRQRRAQLVRHRGDEARLELVELAQAGDHLLDPLGHRVERARGADRLRDAADARAPREVARADLPRGIGELGHGAHDPRLQPAPEHERAGEHEHRPQPDRRQAEHATRLEPVALGAQAQPLGLGHPPDQRAHAVDAALALPGIEQRQRRPVAAAAQGDEGALGEVRAPVRHDLGRGGQRGLLRRRQPITQPAQIALDGRPRPLVGPEEARIAGERVAAQAGLRAEDFGPQIL